MNAILLCLILAVFASVSDKLNTSPIQPEVRHPLSKRQATDDEDSLVYSTRTDVYKLPLKSRGSNITEKSFTSVTSVNGYFIETFDVNFHDNVLLYGINSIYARPVG